MCGINAVISISNIQDKVPYIEQANKDLFHRGPDNSSYEVLSEHNIIFGHTRLSIIDLDNHANQPMKSNDNRFTIVFNGEIYNYIELREKCIENGSIFKTSGDTEVIIESYRHWGHNIFKKFKGMWSFILHDKINNELIICRDPFGIKPLYYTFDGTSLYLSSEIGPLKKAHKHAAEIDEVTLKMFKKSGVLQRGCWTFFENIKKFPHGHFQIINLNTINEFTYLKPQLYWELDDFNFDYENIDIEKKFYSLLEDSVDIHTRADVEIGATLSGGLDSSVITYLAKDKIVKTFTSSFPEHLELDETKKAVHIAEKVNASHHFAYPTYTDLKKDIQDLINAQEEPFGTLSIYTQYKVFKKINEEGLKVSLDGQGADEILGGYKFIANYFIGSYKKESCYSFWKELYSTYVRNRKDPNFMFQKQLLFSKKSDSIKKIKDLIVTKHSGSYEDRMNALNININTHKDLLLFLTFEGNLQQLLHYVDRNSMTFSIESRVPFLTLEFALFSINLPLSYLYKNGRTKFILREGFKEIVHNETYDEKVKLGFPAPDKSWVNNLIKNTDNNNFRDYIIEKWKKSL